MREYALENGGEGDGGVADVQDVLNGVGDEFLNIGPGDGIDYIRDISSNAGDKCSATTGLRDWEGRGNGAEAEGNGNSVDKRVHCRTIVGCLWKTRVY